MSECIFCKIRDRIIPKEFTYEDEDVMVFPDIHPVKPTHLLVVPKTHLADFLDIKDNATLEKIKTIAQKIIKENGLSDKGYRLVVNGGGAQIIDHFHLHITGPVDKGAKL